MTFKKLAYSIQAASESGFEPRKSDFTTFVPNHLLCARETWEAIHHQQWRQHPSPPSPNGKGFAGGLCEASATSLKSWETGKCGWSTALCVVRSHKNFCGFLQCPPSPTLGRSSAPNLVHAVSAGSSPSVSSFIMQPIIILNLSSNRTDPHYPLPIEPPGLKSQRCHFLCGETWTCHLTSA